MAGGGPLTNELDDLVLRLRALVREARLQRRAGASDASLGASRREIESLKARLAELVRHDPTIGTTYRLPGRRVPNH